MAPSLALAVYVYALNEPCKSIYLKLFLQLCRGNVPYMYSRAPEGLGSGPPPPITRHRFGHLSGLDESAGQT